MEEVQKVKTCTNCGSDDVIMQIKATGMFTTPANGQWPFKQLNVVACNWKLDFYECNDCGHREDD